MKQVFKKIFPAMYMRLSIAKAIGMPRLLVNFIFQRILRINGDFPVSLHFTSTVVGGDILFERDISTLTSFAVSGGVYIQALNGITFGKNILFAPGVKFISANHSFEVCRKTVRENRINIGHDVWIGTNAVILPGVTIGDGCVVGAGSVVTKTFNDKGLVIAGNPAKLIRRL